MVLSQFCVPPQKIYFKGAGTLFDQCRNLLKFRMHRSLHQFKENRLITGDNRARLFHPADGGLWKKHSLRSEKLRIQGAEDPK